MPGHDETIQDLLAENELLKSRLQETEEVLEAIRSGEVDALVVSAPDGDQVYTLTGSDQAYRLLFETMNEGAAILGSDGTVFFCNAGLSSMLKTPLETILGGSILRFVTAEDSLSFEALLGRGLKEPQKNEFTLQSHDGEVVPCHISTSPLAVEDSPHICMIVSDLTERKRAEDQLRESERRFREFVQLLPEPVFETDAAGMITFVNQRALRMFGYDEADIEHGINVLEVFAPEERDKVRANFLRIVGREDLGGNEYQCIRKDSTRFPSFIHTAAIVKGDAVVGATGIIIDLSERKRVEEKIKRAEEFLNTVVNNIPVAVFVKSAQDGKFVLWNKASEALFGHSKEEVIGKNDYDFFPKEQADFFWAKDKETLDSGVVIDIPEEPIRIKTGETRILHTRKVPLYGEDQRPHSLLAISEDITERKEAEEALQKERDQAKRYLDTAGVMMVVLNSSGNITLINKKGCETLGYREEEIINRNWFDVCIPIEIREEVKDVFTKLMAGDIAHAEYHENPVLRKDGEQCIIAFHNTVIVDRSSQVTGVLFSGEDITERKEAEAALLREKRFSDAIIDVLPGTFYIFDDQRNLIRWNKNLEQMAEDLGQDIYKMSPLDFFVGDARTRVEEAVRRGFLEGETSVEAEIVADDGNENLYLFIAKRVPLYEKQCLMGVGIDITDRKKALDEQDHLRSQLFQSQKMEAIGTLAGGVAHDFNNLLQVALGYSELILSDEELPRLYRADLQKIHESARRGADLVQRLLTFSRKTEIKPQPLNLNRRIQEMKKMLERTIPKMIEIKLSLGEDLATINADPTQMDQVLMNLAVNAKDAMPEGGKLVFETANVVLDEEYAASHPGARPGRYVLLNVTDTGAGMDEETLSHIFEPFYTTKEVGEGTGLGLAMVHGIVHQHGGHIGCYSKQGEGTTFKFYFPVLAADEESADTAVRAIPRGGSETILLVDDEGPIRDLCSRILSRAGYKVINASDGEEALDLYERRRDEISLVLLDLIMPKMGGKQCLESLLRLNPSVKVVIASGYSASGPSRDALSAEAKGFVNKPYNIQEVLNVVRTVLDEDMAQ